MAKEGSHVHCMYMDLAVFTFGTSWSVGWTIVKIKAVYFQLVDLWATIL
jgi:hypothetical protein